MWMSIFFLPVAMGTTRLNEIMDNYEENCNYAHLSSSHIDAYIWYVRTYDTATDNVERYIGKQRWFVRGTYNDLTNESIVNFPITITA